MTVYIYTFFDNVNGGINSEFYQYVCKMAASRLLEQYSASCKFFFEYITQVDHIFIMLKVIKIYISTILFFIQIKVLCHTRYDTTMIIFFQHEWRVEHLYDLQLFVVGNYQTSCVFSITNLKERIENIQPIGLKP